MRWTDRVFWYGDAICDFWDGEEEGGASALVTTEVME
jgi:hypothetical protein